MKQNLELKQSQHFNLSYHLQQSLQVLSLPIKDLRELIEKELENNPILEEELNKIDASEPYLPDQNYRSREKGMDTLDSLKQNLIAESPSLQEGLLRQMRIHTNDPHELEIGEFIIGNIDDDGYLRLTTQEIAKNLNLTVEDVEKVLAIIQRFEPAGVGARSLAECLIIQLNLKQNKNALLLALVGSALDDVAKKRYLQLSRRFHVPVETIRETVKEIKNLEPKPGRLFKNDRAIPYVIPDVILKVHGDDDYRIIINNDYIPRVNISPKYRMLLNKKDTSESVRQYIKERIKSAYFLIKSIEQRQETIYKVVEYIVNVQNGYFQTGTGLKPLSYLDVAKAVNRHPSTISRVVTNKYIDTPLGIFSLKKFFSHKVDSNNDELSSNEIKERIKMLIEEEDKTKPLSDIEIVDYFAKQGIKLARRTITKYRKQLGILPSNLRKA